MKNNKLNNSITIGLLLVFLLINIFPVMAQEEELISPETTVIEEEEEAVSAEPTVTEEVSNEEESLTFESRLLGMELKDDVVNAAKYQADVIEDYKAYISKRIEEVKTIQNLNQNTKNEIERDLSKIEVELDGIETHLKWDIDENNSYEVIEKVYSGLEEILGKLEDVEIQHKELLVNKIVSDYIEIFQKSFEEIKVLVNDSNLEGDVYDEIRKRVEDIDGVFGQLESEKSETTWVVLEENLKELVKTLLKLKEEQQ